VAPHSNYYSYSANNNSDDILQGIHRVYPPLFPGTSSRSSSEKNLPLVGNEANVATWPLGLLGGIGIGGIISDIFGGIGEAVAGFLGSSLAFILGVTALAGLLVFGGLLFFGPSINTDDSDLGEFDPKEGKKIKKGSGNNKDDTGYEQDDGSVWSEDKGRNSGNGSHGGSTWKKFKNKRDFEKGKREGTYDQYGNRLRK
jgi:hypothetical protein